MTTTLSSIPAELFSLILHSDVAYKAIDLYKCGDTLLNHRLRKAELHISLKDRGFASTSRWPKCLSKFRCLKSLSIVRPDWPILPSAVELRKEIATLAPSLERLELDICDSAGIFDVSAANKTASDPKNDFRLADCFVDLRHLTLRSSPGSESHYTITNESLAWQLPAGLTTLCLDMPPYLSGLTSDLAAMLPRHLEELSLNCENLSLAHNLPSSLSRASNVLDYSVIITDKLLPNLEHMKLGNIDRLFDLSVLPENLKSLDIQYSTELAWSPEQIASLPRQLETLRGASLTLDWPALDAMSQNEDKNAPKEVSWPPALTTLDLSDLTLPNESYLQYLPSALTSLKKLVIRDGHRHNTHPTAAAMRTDDADEVSATCLLPKSLKQLHLSRISPYDMIELPSSLTDLTLDFPAKLKFGKEAPELPNSLTRLTAQQWPAYWFSSLPSSLTELSVQSLVGDFDAENFAKLPQNLRVLEINESKLQIFNSKLNFSHFTDLNTLVLPRECNFKSALLLDIPSTVKHLGLTIHGTPKVEHVQKLDSLVTLHLASNAKPTEDLVNSWPLSVAHPDMNDQKNLFEAKKASQLEKARLYPDPRISSSAMCE